MEELIAFLAGDLEAHEAEAFSRGDGFLAFAAMNDGSKFHGSAPELCLLYRAGDCLWCSRRPSFAAAVLLLDRSLLCFTRAGLVGRSHGQVKALSKKFQQLLAGTESQLRTGINFLNPAFKPAVRRPRFRS
jgi:hypothetical protein